MTKLKKRQVDGEWEITIIKNNEGIEDIRTVWAQMQESEPYPVINADVDRYLSVNQAYGNSRVQPYIILIRKDGRPVAMLIGRIEEMPLKLKLGYKTVYSPKLKCLAVVYGGIIGQPEDDACDLLITKLVEMLRQREVDVVYFSHLRIGSRLYQFSRKRPSVLCCGYFPKVENHRLMSVPENLDRFYQKLSKKHRGNLRRYIKKLEKEYPNQVRIVTYTEEDDLDDAIGVASKISQTTYQHGLDCGFTDNLRTRVLLATAARRGWLRMSVLFINGEPGAFQVGLHYGKKYMLEQIGFDPKWSRLELGTVLFLKVLECICANQDIESIDFGFGDAGYKRGYGDKKWQEASVCIFALRPYPIFVNMLRTSTMGLNASLEYILNKTGLTDWIKRHWRNLLQNKETPKGD